MNAALILGGVGLLLAIWWFKSTKQRMENSLRLYFKELAKWETEKQKR